MQRTVELLQQRLRAAEKARDDAAEQLCSAIQRADSAEADAKSARDLMRQLKDMEAKVNVALELLGKHAYNMHGYYEPPVGHSISLQ